jgi:hypothetical protein
MEMKAGADVFVPAKHVSYEYSPITEPVFNHCGERP